jgi:hypothetical protein
MVRLQELEAWWGATNAAKQLGVTRQAVHYMLKEGRLRGIKTEIGWLVDPVSVEREKLRRELRRDPRR